MELVTRELPDRHAGTVERKRWQDDVDARAVAEAGIAHWRALVDATADAAYDPIDDLAQLGVTFEHDGAENHPAASLDKYLVRVIDHDLGNCVIFKKRLERSEPEHLVE